MALVAYDNSDSSGMEDEDEDAPVVTLNRIPGVAVPPVSISKPLAAVANDHGSSPREGQPTNIFNLLPQPSNKKTVVIEEDDEFLHKKEAPPNIVKPKAKITVPSLSDFKDVEDRPAPKPRTASKTSGLLSMLPKPKGAVTATTKSLIPHILQKPANATVKKPVSVKKPKLDKPLMSSYSDDSDNDDDEMQNDFFSMNKKEELPADLPIDIDKVPDKPIQVQNNKHPSLSSYFKQDKNTKKHVQLQPDYEFDSVSTANDATDYDGAESSSNMELVVESSSNMELVVESSSNMELVVESSSNMEPVVETNGDELQLDEEAIMKLCGSRGKRKREDIQIVDVNQEEVLAGAHELLMRGLMDDTSTRVSASKKKGNEPTGQQKRKHQITYLAHQAKANEAELQNQWANSRVSRRQTQSKYGF